MRIYFELLIKHLLLLLFKLFSIVFVGQIAGMIIFRKTHQINEKNCFILLFVFLFLFLNLFISCETLSGRRTRCLLWAGAIQVIGQLLEVKIKLKCWRQTDNLSVNVKIITIK